MPHFESKPHPPCRASRHYRETAVITADRVELVLMLYRAAINSLRSALDRFSASDPQGRTREINKALEIIGELKATLDFKHGGDIAASLDRLYLYMLERLMEANLRQKPAAVEEALKLLKTLEGAWAQALEKSRLEARPEGERFELSA